MRHVLTIAIAAGALLVAAAATTMSSSSLAFADAGAPVSAAR